MDDDEAEHVLTKKKSKAPPPRRRPKKIVIPKRTPSLIVPGRQIIFTTADKITCAECTCFPGEDPYVRNKKLNPCQKSPSTLYELAATIVDSLKFPDAFKWTEDEVAGWMAAEVGLPQYRENVLDNFINGGRLVMLESPSHLPEINIHDFKHIKKITSHIRKLYGTDFILFCRSIGLPPRKPLTHCTLFKSRSGPTWGIRRNWTRCDILRWMKILGPAPQHIDHWDAVWYQKPDYPRIKFARVPVKQTPEPIPRYKPMDPGVCREYQVPRKFKLQTGIPEEEQLIWMEHRPQSARQKPKPKQKKKKPVTIPKNTNLVPKRIDITNLKGKDLVLARRQMPTPKFLC